MSKTIYISVVFLFIIGIIVSIYQSKRKNTQVSYMIFKFELAVLGVVLANSIFIMTSNIDVAYIAKGIYFGLCDLMIVYMLEYTIEYTGNIKKNKIVQHFYYSYVVLDMVLNLLFNMKGHEVFSLKIVSDYGKNAVFAIDKVHSMFLIHIVFFYTLSAFVIMSFTWSVFNVSKFYKKKYRLINLIFIVTTLISILNLNRDKLMPGAFFIDVSTMIYSILGIFVCYYTLYFVPKGMIGNSLSIINKSLQNGIVCFDLDGRCIYINENAKKLYDNNQNLEGDSIEDKFSEWLVDRDISEIKNQKWDEEILLNGEKTYIEKSFNKLYDENDYCVGCYFMIIDKTAERAAYEKELYISSHDVLSGLYNRETFFHKVTEMIKNNQDRKYVMVCTDIREFKLINDLFGIEKGNEVICKEAEIIKKIAKDTGVCGRIGADRFAVCVEKGKFTEDNFIEGVIEVRKLFPNNIYRVHIYMGVYYIEDIEEMPNLMCDKANFAIGTIKGDYQNYVAYYDEKLLEKTIEEKRMVGEFDQAIENNEFVIFLQPQTNDEGKVIGSEALVRWIHPKFGLLNPGAFIETFEKTGLIYRLDQFVWNEAAKQLKIWKDQGVTDMYISVNISAKDFFYIDIYETVTRLVEKYDIEPDKLKLEITETAIMTDIKKNLKIIKKLQDYGFNIEIDDFGSGYSSLNTLKDICADVVKIDMGFLRKTENEERSNVILKNMISMSSELDMSVITEGVETREQVDKLLDMGCRMFQGYYFAKPMPVSEFEAKYLDK